MKGKARFEGLKNRAENLLLVAIVFAGLLVTPWDALSDTGKRYKILHIMSYHASWAWNEDQLRGFQDAFQGVDVEYRVFEMDTKRNSSEEWMRKVAQEAKSLIDTWKPDLVYANDDNAQQYVVQDYVNGPIPFVFSAVNAAPEDYGFAGSSNITGVLEQEHFLQTMGLLKEIAPGVKKVAVVVDKSPMWGPVLERMKSKQGQLPELEFTSWDVIETSDEFKDKMAAYQNTVDAVGLLGIFQFKDANGKNVDYREVLRWVCDHSSLPDFSYWKDRIMYGTLCTVTVSGYEQGLAAGKIARGILVEGRSPASYAMQPTVKGEAVVSLARARKLGLSGEAGKKKTSYLTL
jgi:ABC-type uncharacterized transport system substrate-binding protein